MPIAFLDPHFEVGEGGHLRDVRQRPQHAREGSSAPPCSCGSVPDPLCPTPEPGRYKRPDIWSQKRKHEIEIGENMVLWHYKK